MTLVMPDGTRTTLEPGRVVTVPTGPPVTVTYEMGVLVVLAGIVTTLVELRGTVIVTTLALGVLAGTVTTLVELGGTVIVTTLGSDVEPGPLESGVIV